MRNDSQYARYVSRLVTKHVGEATHHTRTHTSTPHSRNKMIN